MAKVLTAIVKFSPKQTQQILQKEEDNLGQVRLLIVALT